MILLDYQFSSQNNTNLLLLSPMLMQQKNVTHREPNTLPKTAHQANGRADGVTIRDLELFFCEFLILLSIEAVQIYILPRVLQKFPFRHILRHVCYSWIYVQQVWGDISLRFWFVFQWWLVMLNTFTNIWISSFEVCLCRSFAHLKKNQVLCYFHS